MPIQLFRTYQFQLLIFQIPSLLFSFTYCSAHKIVMNLSVSVSVVSVPVSDVQLQFFYPINTLVQLLNTYRFQFLLFQLQCLLFSFVYCSAYTVVLSLSAVQSRFLQCFCNALPSGFIPLHTSFSFCLFSFSLCCSVSDTAPLTPLSSAVAMNEVHGCASLFSNCRKRFGGRHGLQRRFRALCTWRCHYLNLPHAGAFCGHTPHSCICCGHCLYAFACRGLLPHSFLPVILGPKTTSKSF